MGKDETAVGKASVEKRVVAIKKEQQVAKITTSETIKAPTIVDYIRFNATSMPAVMLYLVLLMVSFNTLRHWSSENR